LIYGYALLSLKDRKYSAQKSLFKIPEEMNLTENESVKKQE